LIIDNNKYVNVWAWVLCFRIIDTVLFDTITREALVTRPDWLAALDPVRA
jgi:hypothetical protein